MKKQKYNSRLDESLGERRGSEKSKKQSLMSRREESKAMEKAEGRRVYKSVKSMDKKSKKK